MLTSEELDELIERSNSCDFHYRSEAKLLESLRELKARRESDLVPVNKFLSNTVDEQMVRITEEYAEVYNAAETYINNNVLSSEDDIEDEAMYEVFAHEDAAAKDHLTEELVDLQTACETMLKILGLCYFDRLAVRKRVIEKNRARGYYGEAK